MLDIEEDKKSKYSFWGTNTPTRNLVIGITVVYIIEIILSLFFFRDGSKISLSSLITIKSSVLAFIGQYNLLVFHGFVYELFSAIFVHANLAHYFFNVLGLLYLGLRAEESLYDRDYYLTFFLSALAGNLLTLFVYPLNSISCGASGGIFGILGIDLVLAYESDKSKSIWSYLLIGLVYVLMSVGPNVNTFAHVLGLIVGAILAKYVFKRRKEQFSYDEYLEQNGIDYE